jgi:hypothetical protein
VGGDHNLGIHSPPGKPPPPTKDPERGAGGKLTPDKLPPQRQCVHEFAAPPSFAPGNEQSTSHRKQDGLGIAAPPQAPVDFARIVASISPPSSVNSILMDDQIASSRRKRNAVSNEPASNRRVKMAPSIMRAKLALDPTAQCSSAHLQSAASTNLDMPSRLAPIPTHVRPTAKYDVSK